MHKGQLVTWKDDRGFGFIKPNDASKEVFLHISALKGAGRRPKVGDTIFYELVTEADGKVRASKASIHGVAPQPLPTKQKVKKRGLLETVIGIAVIAAIALFTIEFSRSRSLSNYIPHKTRDNLFVINYCHCSICRKVHGKYFYDSIKFPIRGLSHSIVSALCGKPAT